MASKTTSRISILLIAAGISLLAGFTIDAGENRPARQVEGHLTLLPSVVAQAPVQPPLAIPPPPSPIDRYNAAIELVNRERFSEAAQKLEAILPVTDDPALLARARFLAGYCRYMSRSWKLAPPHFEDYIIKSKGILTDYARYYRALSLTFGGDSKTAAAAWKLFFDNHPATRWDWEAKINYAKALLDDNKSADSLKILKTLLSKTKARDQRARILLMMGNCYEAQKHFDSARETYRSIYIWHPASASASEASKRLVALKSNPENLSIDERYNRAEELYSRARYESALQEFSTLLADKRCSKTDERGRKIAIRRAMCLYRMYRTDEALQAFQSFINDLPDGAYTSTSYYYSGHCYGRKERNQEAMASYRAVIEKTPKSSLVPNAFLNIAQIYGELGQWDNAVANLQAIRRHSASASRKHDVPWRIGWIEYRRGNCLKAREAFLDHPGGRDLTDRRNEYWAARALEKAGKAKEAKEEYKALVAEQPYDFYGIFAATRIGGPIAAPMETASPEVHLAAVPNLNSPFLERARELAQMGLTDFAAEELEELEDQPGLSQDDQYAIALLYQQFGNYYFSRRSVYRHSNISTQNYDPANNKYWRLLYPQAYRQTVTKRAAERGLDPNLVWSIIMQESNFKPHIVSSAGARGLMQLILPTAKNVARKLGKKDYEESDLFDPEINILFGSTYLADVINGFGSHPARHYMAVASYNGGPMNVKRWRKARPDLEVDEWIEEIPFNETRNYVKRVFGNWAVYQMLYGKASVEGVTAPVGVPMVIAPVPPDNGQ